MLNVLPHAKKLTVLLLPLVPIQSARLLDLWSHMGCLIVTRTSATHPAALYTTGLLRRQKLVWGPGEGCLWPSNESAGAKQETMAFLNCIMQGESAHLALALLSLLGEALLVGHQRGQAAVPRLHRLPQSLLLPAPRLGIRLGLPAEVRIYTTGTFWEAGAYGLP